MSKSVILLALIVIAPSARATTLVPADLGELSRDAIAIARGRVVSVDARWTDDRRAIETLVTIDVAGYLKGDLGSTLQFRVPGGQLGRLRSIDMLTSMSLAAFMGSFWCTTPAVHRQLTRTPRGPTSDAR